MVLKQPLGGRAVLLDLVQRFQDSYPPEGQLFFTLRVDLRQEA